MDAIVTAGGTLKAGDPLLDATGIEKKALIPLAGKQMVAWVLKALRESGVVENVAIVGVAPDELEYVDDRLYFMESRGNLIDNIFAGLEKLQEITPDLKKFLLFSSDIPLVTPEIVRGFVEECGTQEADMYYTAVEERTMEARFPNSKRSYVPLKGGRYCGGDAFLIDVAAAHGNVALARQLISNRKDYLAQVRLAGFGFIIRFLLRRMTVHEAARRVADRIGFNPRVVDTRFAELGMDLDKLHQYQMIKTELEQRQHQTG